MKIVIEFNNDLNFNEKEKLKRLIDREDFNERLKNAIDNGQGLNVENPFGRWVYTIRIEKDKR